MFKKSAIRKRIGAAYYLRSKYFHTGVPFGHWVEPGSRGEDLQLGAPIVDNRSFAKILENAPKFAGLERLIRYCLLMFMRSKGLLRSEGSV